MAIQTATTGNLENAQRIAIAQCRFTAEHDAPCVNLVEHLTLRKGEKQLTVPKVAQMTANGLTDGVDMVDTKDIGMTTTDLTTAEVGLKVILTDKLTRQENEDVFRIVGRQMGDGMARKKDTDVIALFSALNAGTTLGVATTELTVGYAMACIAEMQTAKAPRPWACVHHPYAIHALVSSAAAVGTYPATAYSEALLKDNWSITIDGVPFFHDGNITIDSSGDGVGAIFSKNAMCVIDSQELRTERERDASLRAWEVVVTADYGCFELDDDYGFPMTYDCAVATHA